MPSASGSRARKALAGASPNTESSARTGSGHRGTYARGVERREELLQAVLRLIARSGVGDVTHRAVAKEAGVSLRATTYYFDSKDTMIREALRHFAAQNVARADAMARSFPSHGCKLDAAVDAVVGVMIEEMGDPSRLLAAEYELILAVSRMPAYAPEYHELQRTLEHRLSALMAAVGSRSPRSHARIVLAASRGLQLEHLSRPESPLSRRDVRHLMRTLISSLVPSSEDESF